MSHQGLILIVEDLEDDIILIKRSLQKAGVSNPIRAVRSGDEAISYLKGEWEFAKRDQYPFPTLVLLDLKMPRTDGFEVLRWIRQQPGLKALRVIVLTSSEDIRDVNKAYELGANSFLVKPMEFENFVGMSKFLGDYWLRRDVGPAVSRPEDQRI